MAVPLVVASPACRADVVESRAQQICFDLVPGAQSSLVSNKQWFSWYQLQNPFVGVGLELRTKRSALCCAEFPRECLGQSWQHNGQTLLCCCLSKNDSSSSTVVCTFHQPYLQKIQAMFATMAHSVPQGQNFRWWVLALNSFAESSQLSLNLPRNQGLWDCTVEMWRM